jgi:hypothetical protein
MSSSTFNELGSKSRFVLTLLHFRYTSLLGICNRSHFASHNQPKTKNIHIKSIRYNDADELYHWIQEKLGLRYVYIQAFARVDFMCVAIVSSE